MLSARSKFLLTFSARLGSRITIFASFATMTVVSMLSAVIALKDIDNTVMVPALKTVVSSYLGFAIFTVLNSQSIQAKISQNIGHTGRNFEVLGVRKVGAVIGSPLIPDTIFGLQSKKEMPNSKKLVIVILLDTAELVPLLQNGTSSCLEIISREGLFCKIICHHKLQLICMQTRIIFCLQLPKRQ